jgi:hypothetical protein
MKEKGKQKNEEHMNEGPCTTGRYVGYQKDYRNCNTGGQ